MPVDTLVCIIDDDEAIRESLRLLLYAGDLRSVSYPSADAFLADQALQTIDCLLLDIRMPGTDGLELFRILKRRRFAAPVIFITGHGDIPLAVSAIKQGAFDFLTKPFMEGELLAKVRAAIEHSRSGLQQRLELQNLQSRVDACTPRERDVMQFLVKGLSNKGIAETLGISPRTVEIHRAHVMEKMEADSLPTLVRMIAMLDTGDATDGPPAGPESPFSPSD
ncbi:MAG: response regulator transcription factor [Xanthomonadales bacterium]|nr:response regulator [Gammaproteobacteria bacterium]NNL05999.1 response regulator transcription factor [Xanthomonadales bacterium]